MVVLIWVRFSFRTRSRGLEVQLLPIANLPSSVTNIDREAFCSCVGLSEIKFPRNLKNIGSGGFAACNSLIDVSIPQSVESIGDYAFYHCLSLRRIRFEGDAPHSYCDLFEDCPSNLVIEVKAGTKGWFTEPPVGRKGKWMGYDVQIVD